MIKRLSLICLGLWCAASLSYAQTGPEATLAWSPNVEGDLAGYHVYQSTVSGSYTEPPAYRVLYDQLSITVPILQQRCNVKYFWVVTALDYGGNESRRSIEVSKTIVGSQYWIGACKKQ